MPGIRISVHRSEDGQSAPEGALLPLFTAVFGHAMSVAQWRWKYQGPSASECIHIVAWQDHDGQEQAVGHVGALLLPGQFRGQPHGVAQLMDVMVLPTARGGLSKEGTYGQLMLSMAQCLQERAHPVLAYGFPGATPARLGQRMGLYRLLCRVSEQQLAAHGASTRTWWSPSVHPQEWDDGWLDRMWQRCQTNAEAPTVRKDAAYVAWRYRQHPQRSYRLWRVCSAWGRDWGWLITQEADGPWVVDACLARQALRSDRLVGCISALARSSGVSGWKWWQAVPQAVHSGVDPGVRPGAQQGEHAAVSAQLSLVWPGEFRCRELCGQAPSAWALSDQAQAHSFWPGDTDVF